MRQMVHDAPLMFRADDSDGEDTCSGTGVLA
jgi:hypothetical protein